MLRLSKLTDYGAVVMAHMAREPERLYTAADIADEVQIPRPTVSKTLKMLSKAGLLVSHRGAQGGYGLARSPQQISAGEIINAIEGPVAMTECSQTEGQCDLVGVCGVADNWQRVNLAIHQLLKTVTLAQLAQRHPLQLEIRTMPTLLATDAETPVANEVE